MCRVRDLNPGLLCERSDGWEFRRKLSPGKEEQEQEQEQEEQ